MKPSCDWCIFIPITGIPSLFQIMTTNTNTDNAYMNTEIPISQTHQ